ncbi:hypothetical protein ACQFYA_10840 [Promicromonospora sp. Marseille-Q5078]
MWGWIWAGLVVGTLVGAFFLGRHLWRVGVRTLREASRAGEALGSAGDRVSAAVAEAEAHRVDTSPTLFDDPTALRERVAQQRRRRAARATERRARQAATWQRWDAESWLSRRTAEKAGRAQARAHGRGPRAADL